MSKLRKSLPALVFFILLCIPFSLALTSTATVNVKNYPVKIELIKAEVVGNNLTLKVKLSDKNGYKDIKEVEVNVLSDIGYSGYKRAEFDSGNGIKALYVFRYRLDSKNYEGVYTLRARARDSRTSAESEIKYEASKKQNKLTGAFLRAPKTEGGLLDFLINWIRNLFG